MGACCQANHSGSQEVSVKVEKAQNYKTVTVNDLNGNKHEIPLFDSLAEKDQGFQEYLQDIQSQEKEFFAAFLVEQFVYQAFAIFGQKFLPDDEVSQITKEVLGTEDLYEREDVINALNKVYEDKIRSM